MSMKWISLLLIQLSFCFNCGTCGKVLVWPSEYSHWINIKTILDELIQRGHEVTVLTSSASILIDLSTPSATKFEVYPTSLTKDDFEFLFMKWIRKSSNDLLKDTFWTYFSVVQEITGEYSDYIQQLLKNVVFIKKLMMKSQQSRVDVILADAIGPCGELLAELLKIPFLSFVYCVLFTIGYTFEKYSEELLTPPSYVPIVMLELQDGMTFLESKNMIYVLYFDFLFQTFKEKKWDQFYSEVLGRPTTLCETMGKLKYLIRTYWDFEFPHPLLPHFDFVGGLQCQPANPLRKEIQEFVQSSGEYGVVVLTPGSMVRNITEERAHTIASALAQIPQKVDKKFSAKKPEKLKNKTREDSKKPRNTLISGHLRLYWRLLSGGEIGGYRGFLKGDPIRIRTALGEEKDNTQYMEDMKGTATHLHSFNCSNTDQILACKLKSLKSSQSYKENAIRLSAICHDQPFKPLDRAICCIQFVMLHKGTKHLRPATLSLTWYQYHSLDMIGFLLACVGIVTFLVLKCCLFGYRKFFKAGKKKKK
uniref:glucuronosyltransferase n=1 Tax=Loxodonta africana TaxID=9785 RepID=G3UJU3_LOXAF